MICLNCNQETFKIFTEKSEEDGITKTLVYCPLCPRKESKARNFPAIIVKGGGRNSKPEIRKEKYAQYALTPEEIKETQKMKPRVIARDTPLKRHLENFDLQRQKKIAKCFIGSYGPGTNVARANKVYKTLASKLGTENYSIKSDDGFKVVAEVNN